jgi:predicted O-linked N-acetylglucosamine transferase (SPINDLY family)
MAKPAPVAVSWLGYAGTTGVARIDGRIGDAIADPPANDPHFTERLVRLDGPFLAYTPRGPTPDPATARVPAAGGIVFGSFNVTAKLNDSTLALWARILAGAPGSTLALKDNWRTKPRARARVEALAARAGLPPDRLRYFDYRLGDADHLETYGRIDVALDPFPYNGTTTTCEALWMGVPVVTLAGTRHAGRVGASLLTHAGFAEWVARDPDDYVRIALDLAGAPSRLRALRAAIRPQFAASPVCDLPGFARRFEAALDALWEDFARNAPQGESR